MNPQNPQPTQPINDIAPQSAQPPAAPQPPGATVSNSQPSVVVMKKSGKMKHAFLWLLALILIAGAAGGVYYWQHQQVTDLQGQVTTLTAQLKSAKADETQTGTNATSSLNPLGSVQQKADDSLRQSDIQSIHTYLEAFFSENNHYPSLADLNSATWRTANLKDFDSNSLADPANPTVTQLAAAPAAKAYAYQVTDSTGTSCETDDTKCTKYTLTATFQIPQNGATTYTKTNAQ